MKLKKWEKDMCRAYVNMYMARGVEIDISWLEPEVSRAINNMNNDHRYLIEEFLMTL